MTTPDVLSALDYYARHGCALFPMRAGSKAPVGIISSFVHDCSTDAATWQEWASGNPGCNFGVVAGASRLIIVDIDVKQGRDAAWAAWCDLCAQWGIPVAMPHVATPSGGWHVYFACDADPASLRQPDAIKGVINVRAGNGFTVAAGSTFQDRPYVLLSADPPHPASAALVEHCTRRTVPVPSHNLGTRDKGDVAAMLQWLVEREAFAAYEDWLSCGMALKTEFGDAGFDLWMLTTWPEAHDAATAKWASFASDATSASVTLNSILARAHALGWRGTVRKSASAMFDTVAALAAGAGATLSGASPMPMVAGQEVLTRICTPMLAEFLAATVDCPSRPANPDFPALPDAVSGHGLFVPLQDCIARVVAMAEDSKWKPKRVTEPLAVLFNVHRETFDSVIRRVQTLGRNLSVASIKQRAIEIGDQVEREFIDQGDWHRDIKGNIESDNSDNVAVFLGILGCELRWNAWLERAEIRGGRSDQPVFFKNWTFVDDDVVALLRTRGNRTKTRFRPSKEFFWESLLALARSNTVDPAIDHIAGLAASWDGQARLSTWLSRVCGTPCDLYHQAVARNIVGGMVRRIREPGCKHDEIVILYGPQGTGKSTLASLLSPFREWFSDEVMLGDESKELVLSLAGKCVIEVAEMGMRGASNTNHIKAMLSRTIDRGRTAYARTVTDRPRRNIFVGTTNDDDPLTDPTGNRRFLPVRIDTEIDLAWLCDNAGQIIGEAAVLHSAGASFAIPRSVWSIAGAHQEAARAVSDIEIQLHAWFGETSFSRQAFITADDLLRACNRANLRGSPAARASIMKRLDFQADNVYLNGKRTRIWLRGKFDGAVRYIVGSSMTGEVQVNISARQVP